VDLPGLLHMSLTGSGYAIELPRRRLGPALEAVIPILAAQAYIWAVPHERPRWWDVVCGGLVAAFLVLAIVRSGPRGWRAFGLGRRADHWRAARPLALMTCGGVLVVLAYGWMTDQLRRDWDILAALAAYPVWGCLQQGVMLAFVYPRLRTALGLRWAPLATAMLFGLAHIPNLPLMLGGVALVLGYAIIWERAPSLPLTGLSHGLIGAVCDKALHVSMRVGAHYFE
jgi:membrane protease YdiL (CAAX protease family)